jgi:hypothetical protein
LALLMCDSFDDRPITAIGDRYESHQYNVAAASGIYAGRTGNGLGLSTGILDVADHITWQSASQHQSLYVGIAWEQGYQSGALCSIRYNGTAQVFAQLNSDRTISIIRYDAGANTVLATSAQTVPTTPLTTFYYVEFYAKISPTVGAYELRIDGTRWLSASGVNTSSTGDSFANQVRITNLSSVADGAYSIVDDFYIADDDYDDGNALIIGFAGPVKIACRMPAANGATVEMTPNTGLNYSAVDDFGKDDDTTYVAGDTEGEADVYALDDLEIPLVEIMGVAVHQWARKEDALARTFYPLARVGGVEYRGDEKTLTTSYARYFHAYERNPATGLAWTREALNLAEIGCETGGQT